MSAGNSSSSPPRHQQDRMSDESASVKDLQPYTTCDVSDALCKLKNGQIQHRTNGGFLAGLTMWSPERQSGDVKIIGPAYTVQYRPVDDPAPKIDHHYIDTVPRNAVLFLSCPRQCINAGYGGLMSQRARTSGAVGSVIDGRFRDLQEQREMGFPIFARDVGTAPPYHEMKVCGINVEVEHEHLGIKTTIKPGDYLIADLNGVVVLPQELKEQVLPLMKKQVEADAKVAADIQAGSTFVEASKKHRDG